MTDTRQAGWHADPTGRFTHRYFDGTAWTEHVSTEGATSSDPYAPPPEGAERVAVAPDKSNAERAVVAPPPPVKAAAKATATVKTGASVAVVDLPDDDASAQRRRRIGWSMIAICGLVAFSMFLPWVAGAPEHSDGDPVTLAGYEFTPGTAAAFTAVLLAAYAYQAVARPRVRFHVAAAVGLGFMMIGTFAWVGFVEEEDLAKLDVAPRRNAIVIAGDSSPSGVVDAAERVDEQIGIQVAAAGELALIIPLALLWRDDRRRRRDAGLLL